ncbi:F0F1 ATP synthase subunit alpha, partial [Vibrio sp. FNV 38]|nr:F0F1 ATP synthase subunit alpha [Vibrio sp. FNV 38]
ISVSRVGGAAQIKGMKKVAGELKLLYAQYRELQAFAQFGSDLDADTKARLALGARIVEVLKQKRSSPVHVGCQVAIVYAVTNGYLNDVEPAKVAEYEEKLFRYLMDRYGDLLKRIEKGSWEDSDIAELKKALSEFRR